MKKGIKNINAQDAILIVNIGRLFRYPSKSSLMCFFGEDNKLFCSYAEYLGGSIGMGYPLYGEVVSFLNGTITVSYDENNSERFYVQQIEYLTPKKQAQFELNGLL